MVTARTPTGTQRPGVAPATCPPAAATITAVPTGTGQTRLIILRGNSGSGKSTVAKALRDAHGRGLAWVSQDLIRRVILQEKDRPGGANIGLISHVARYALDHGYHAVLDGIFYADRYEPNPCDRRQERTRKRTAAWCWSS